MGLLDTIFGRKAAGQSGVLMLGLSDSTNNWRKRDYTKLSAEGYESNVTAFAGISKIARAGAGIPWMLVQRSKTGKGRARTLVSFAHAAKHRDSFSFKAQQRVTVEDHDLLKRLERPNPLMAGGKYQETLISHLLISGNRYEVRVGPKHGPPMELWPLRPDRTRVVPGDTRKPVAGYVHRVNGEEQVFPFEAVKHLHTFAPLDDFYGLSPLSVAGADIDTDNAAARWNHNLLANDARPAGALTTKGVLPPPQFERLKSMLKEQYSGAANARRPMLLEAGLEWQQFSLTPAEMDHLGTRRFSKRQIGVALGIDPILLGDDSSARFATYPEARKALYLETVLPLMDVIRDEYNAWLVEAFGDGLYLDYNKDAIEALQEDREKVWARVRDANWMTLNEKRRATGFEDDPDGDVILVESMLTPLDRLLEGNTLPEGGGFDAQGNPIEQPKLPGKKPKPGDDDEDENTDAFGSKPPKKGIIDAELVDATGRVLTKLDALIVAALEPPATT